MSGLLWHPTAYSLPSQGLYGLPTELTEFFMMWRVFAVHVRDRCTT